jgi:hypothetical protein
MISASPTAPDPTIAATGRVVKPDAPILSTDCSALARASRPGVCDVVLYHGQSCPDGFASAFAAWKRLGDAALYVAMDHGPAGLKSLPDVAGKHVVVVDFSFSAAVTAELRAKAASFLVLDHHASAERELRELPEEHKVFDMGQSGCKYANTPHPPTRPPARH